MQRRNFIKNILPLAAIPLVSNRLFASVIPTEAVSPEALALLAGDIDRVLVLIRLHGGNDGLNTVIPLDQYAKLIDPKVRKPIMLAEQKILKLTDSVGLHAAMPEIRNMFTEKKLTIVQGVANSAGTFSHFHGMDQWDSASDRDHTYSSGWIGRYLEKTYAQAPVGYPNFCMPDPLALEIGAAPSLIMRGSGGTLGQSVPVRFDGQLTQLVDLYNNLDISNNMKAELAYLRSQQEYTNDYGNKIVKAWTQGTNSSAVYPASVVPATGYFGQTPTSLAQQLKIVARLLKGGLKTRIFVANIGNFDTHEYQGSESGKHAMLLRDLSGAIGAFQKDLENLGLADRVVGMTYSEFGRRVVTNDADSTEHGLAAPMFVFGTKVSGNIIGNNYQVPDLALVNAGTQVDVQYDYRQVYMSVLKNWFSICQSDAIEVIRKDVPETAGVFKSGTALSPIACGPLVDAQSSGCTVAVTDISGDHHLLHATIQPNPSDGNFSIVPRNGFDFSKPVTVIISDIQGKIISRQTAVLQAGQPIDVNLNNTPGLYLVQLKNAQYSLMQKIVVGQ